MPVIGVGGVPAAVSWGFWEQAPVVLTAETYLGCLRRAGALPVILPPGEPTQAGTASLLERLDGLLLTGGSDLDPARYGQVATDALEDTDPVRDDFELALATAALDRGLPVLGICRGLQILNVATGGTLHQHLIDEGYAEHRPAPGCLDERSRHDIRVEPDSLLGEAGLAGLSMVNSHHHQGIAELGRGARVIARATDGVIEAVQWSGHPFALGVQWHPEDPPLDRLFACLVEASRVPCAAA